jgi:hypothetical protein
MATGPRIAGGTDTDTDTTGRVGHALVLRRVLGAAVAVRLGPCEVEVDRRYRTYGRHRGNPELPGTGLWPR